MNQDAIQVQTFIFNLRSLTKAFHEVFRNYGPFYTQCMEEGFPTSIICIVVTCTALSEHLCPLLKAL